MSEWTTLLEDAIKINEGLEKKEISFSTRELIEESVEELFLNLNKNEELFLNTLKNIKNKEVKEIAIEFGNEIILKNLPFDVPDTLLYIEYTIPAVEQTSAIVSLYENVSYDYKRYIEIINKLPGNSKKNIKKLNLYLEKDISKYKYDPSKVSILNYVPSLLGILLLLFILYSFISFYLFIFHGFFGINDFLTGFWEFIFFEL